MLILCTLDLIWWEGHFTLVVFLPKTCNSCPTMRKRIRLFLVENILQNPWPILLLRSSNTREVCETHAPEEPKETWRLNIIWCPNWNLETEKGHEVKTKKIWIKYGLQLISKALISVHYLWQTLCSDEMLTIRETESMQRTPPAPWYSCTFSIDLKLF